MPTTRCGSPYENVRWRNQRARPKTNFASSSPIRSWTGYPAKAA
jgi:hypothetical protein